jgi:MYXO-CTERM domain-containing protein
MSYRLVVFGVVALGSLPAHAANVLVIGNNNEVFVADDFAANTSHVFSSWNANFTPTLEDLQQYEAVLLYENGNFGNAPNVGDVVAQYAEQGGGVVTATFFLQDHSLSSGIGWGALEQYDPFLPSGGGCEYNSDDLDPATIVDHPITTGVAMIHANSYRGGASAKADATVLALWSTPNPDFGPDPVVGFRQEGNACVVGITIFPDGSFNDFSGDVYILFDNALEFSVECASPGPCGNGVLEDGELCDDGNFQNNDGCVTGCVPASCGDGFTYLGVEPCDDGDGDNTDACLVGCVLPTCGDGFVRTGVEECDDVNADNTDACLDNCQAASCGDGFLQAGVEVCDDGNLDNTDACPGSCAPAVCGDGYPYAGVEPCDDGNDINDDQCLVGCIAPTCGDGYLQPGVEACDDANDDDTDTCVGATCQLASCGDGFVFAGFEECDDGNDVPNDGCTSCDLDEVETTSGDPTGSESSSTTEGEGSSDGTSEGGETTSGETTGGDETTGDPTAADTSDGSASATMTTDEPPGTSEGGESESSGASGGATDEAGGCACAADERTGLASWLGVLAVGMLRRRRRR